MTIGYAYAGDSITNPDNSWSWTRFITDQFLVNRGGTAISGNTSGQILAAITPVADADVLVIALGTNDVRLGKTRAEVKNNLQGIVDKMGVAHVVISMVPPCNLTDYGDDHINRAAAGFALNRDIAEIAATKGWLHVDPWFAFRRVDNTWASGSSNSDGVHPTVDTGTAAAAKLTTYIRQAVEGAKA